MQKFHFFIALILGLLLSLVSFFGERLYVFLILFFWMFFLLQIFHVLSLIFIHRKNFEICFNLCPYFAGVFLPFFGVAFPNSFLTYLTICVSLNSAWIIYVIYMFSFRNKSPQILLHIIRQTENEK
ncbi:MAG: hypothetical protein RJA07_2807 [Bacteroidota bacterium]|jgi:hypothetical protein